MHLSLYIYLNIYFNVIIELIGNFFPLLGLSGHKAWLPGLRKSISGDVITFRKCDKCPPEPDLPSAAASGCNRLMMILGIL